jgi:pimeloyl-ACP methyl ester carboxylesterase
LDLDPRSSPTAQMEAHMRPRRMPKLLKAPKVALAFMALSAALGTTSPRAQTAPVKNIVLVHGAFADASGWKGVYDVLVKDGYSVSMVQEPETTFKDDVAATKRVLALQDGPCILVGHSYGGMIITEAGMDPSVVGLVYIAAYMPEVGESVSDVEKRFPSDPTKTAAITKTPDGYVYLNPVQFHAVFAADVPAPLAAFMAQSQVATFGDIFGTKVTAAAWHTKPSWMLVPGSDRTINPELERWFAARAKSHKLEVPGASHAVFVSDPQQVAALIEQAAKSAR